MGYKVGLDFGTSNSGVAVYHEGGVRHLPIDRANIVPEVVKTILYITRDEQCFIGQEAVKIYYQHNVNRLRRFVNKRVGEIEYVGAEMAYMRDIFVTVDELTPGRLLRYLKTALRKENERMAYQGTKIFEKYYAITELIQIYLAALKTRAEQELGGTIDSVVIGRPVKFSDQVDLDIQAEQSLRKAALGAGFKQVDFELEPVAAALNYEQSTNQPEKVVVFDFGGGTLDIAIMVIGDTKSRVVLASDGIDVAGSDFDRAIIQKRLLKFFGIDQAHYYPEIFELIQAVPDWISLPELSTPLNRQRLQNAIHSGVAPARLESLKNLIFNDLAFSFYNMVELSKISLSSQEVITIAHEDPGIFLWDLYTRYQFEKDIAEYASRIKSVLDDTLKKSGLHIHEIDAVVRTGGSSSIPLFIKMLEDTFGAHKIKETDLFSGVSAGLAISASLR